MELHGAIEEYLLAKQNSLTTKTFHWYSYFLDRFERWCQERSRPINKLEQITPALVQQFAADTTPNTHTRHGRAQIVKGFLSWCARDGELGVKRSLVERIEMPKLVQSDVELFSPEDIRRLLACCEKLSYPHRSKALIHVLLDTGVRASELCFDSERPAELTGLRMVDLYISRGEDAYLRVMGKGQKSRTVGFGHETSLALYRYINRERVGSSEFVFLAQGGAPLSVRMLQHFLDDLGERAGVSDCHAHRFRHTFAVSQLIAGTSDLVLMRLLGHTSLEATKIYVRAMTQVQARQAAPSIMDRMKGRSSHDR